MCGMLSVLCVRNEIFVVLMLIIIHLCDSLHNYHGTVYDIYFSHKFVFVDPSSI